MTVWRTAAGPPQARQGSRCARPVQRLAALTGQHPARLGPPCGHGLPTSEIAWVRPPWEVIAQRGVHIGHSFGGSRVRHCGYGLLSQV
jgi:hypothetical protein